jgi:hypothetical protein
MKKNLMGRFLATALSAAMVVGAFPAMDASASGIEENAVKAATDAYAEEVVTVDAQGREIHRQGDVVWGIVPVSEEEEAYAESYFASRAAAGLADGELSESVVNTTDTAFWKSMRCDYAYDQADARLKTLFDRYEAACLELVETATDAGEVVVDASDLGFTMDNVWLVCQAAKISHPQYYFVSNYMGASRSGSTVTYLYFPLYNEFTSGSARVAASAAFKDKVNSWTSGATSGRLVDREKKINDVVCGNIYYDYDCLDYRDHDADYTELDWNQSAYSGMFDGKTVCAGYASATACLLNRAGLESLNITSVDHQYNAVYLYGQWYQLDTTWNDGNGGSWSYEYFNKNDDTDPGSSHDYLPEIWGFCYPEQPYDSTVGSSFESPYFTEGAFTYFKVNDNSSLGDYLAVVIEGGETGFPATVTNGGKTYRVLGYDGGGAPEDEQVKQIRAFVSRLYTVILGRAAEADGLDDWTNRLATGAASASQVAGGIIFSDEFKQKNYCNEHFLQTLYLGLFNRAYDEGGYRDWLNRMEKEGLSRERVVNGFFQGDEFKNLCAAYGMSVGEPWADAEFGTIPKGACSHAGCGKQAPVVTWVTHLYGTALHRTPDAGGLEDWINWTASHKYTGRDVITFFFTSEEYVNVLKVNDDQFLTDLYNAIFDRDPDAGGFADWQNRMKNEGYSRVDVINGFAGSEEFRNTCHRIGINVGL